MDEKIGVDLMRKVFYLVVFILVLIESGISEINFKEHIVGENLNFTMSVISCDLDKDGDKDILGAAYIADGVKWWENDGSQNFTEHVIGENYGSTRTIFAADVNRDGFMDVLSAGADSGKVTWWENDGNQNF
ncbi:MAG: VCBS repeat-containing protein, partial [Calditrichia bacterium]|nr:VCBS repeat-containing protein [Calditrichia bacterium]